MKRDFTFDGFEPSNTTPVPDVLFDVLLPKLSGAELKVLLYIIRRTWGFKKATDAISISQFTDGIVTKDKRVLDEGCGIKRRETVIEALNTLEAMGCIASQKGKETAGDNATSVYCIHFKEVVSKPDYLTLIGGFKTGLPVVSKPDYGSPITGPRVVSKPDPQLDSIQETDSQETVIQEREGVSANASTPPALSSSEDDFSEEDEPPPTVKMSAIKLNGQTPSGSHAAIGNAEQTKGNTHGTTDSSYRTDNRLDHDSRGILLGGEDRLLSERSSGQIDASQQTPGVSLQDDQAQPSLLLDPEPAQAAFPPAARSASAPGTAQATGKPEKPKRGGRQKPVEEPIPEEAIRIMDDWDVLMKRACPRTAGEKGTIAAAVSLVPCHPSREVLKSVWQFCFKSNPDWYRIHGVGLQDIAKNIGKWQSLQVPEEVAPPLVDTNTKKKAPGTSDFDIYKGNGVEERAALLAHYEELKASGELLT